MATEFLTKEQVLQRDPNASFGYPSVWTDDASVGFSNTYFPGAHEVKMGYKVGDWREEPGYGYHQVKDENNSGDFGESFLLPAVISAGTAGIGGWAAGLGGAGGITADSIAAGIAGGENLGGAMYGLGSGAGSLGAVANTAGGSMPVGNYDPFAYTPEFEYGNLSGFTPGDFTASQLPGGDLSMFGGTGGMVDLGGTGAIPGVDIGGSASGILTELAKKVGTDAAKSLFQRFMAGDASALDVLGAAAPGLISEFFRAQQAGNLQDSLTKIADQARADRSPFLDYAKTTLAGGPEAYAAGAGSQALKGVLAKLSARFGNPIGAPAALGIATDSALNNWGNDWRQAANIGLGGNYSQLATNAATAGAGTSGAGFGDAAASVFAPQQKSLSDLMKSLNLTGLA